VNRTEVFRDALDFQDRHGSPPSRRSDDSGIARRVTLTVEWALRYTARQQDGVADVIEQPTGSTHNGVRHEHADWIGCRSARDARRAPGPGPGQDPGHRGQGARQSLLRADQPRLPE